MEISIALIVSTYNQPEWLRRCLLALGQQTDAAFELLIADDGSDERTQAVIRECEGGFAGPVRHVWQADQGFRKTRILNKAILKTQADYLVFIDGDCVAQPDFVKEHRLAAKPGSYLNGSIIRLSQSLSVLIDEAAIRTGSGFNAGWLSKKSRSFNRRYLRLMLAYGLRSRLNRHTPTRLYWLGSNSSCFRADALAVNGFDNRFSYGFEDGDFGRRLGFLGVQARTVRWTANLLHLWHDRPWSDPETLKKNHALMLNSERLRIVQAIDGLSQLPAEN